MTTRRAAVARRPRSTTSTSTTDTSVAGPSTTESNPDDHVSAGRWHPSRCSSSRVEDCFNAAAPSTEPAEVEEVELVPCEEEHDSEVFAQTAFESADPAYPGEDELIDYATRFCVDAFEPYVGLPYADSALHRQPLLAHRLRLGEHRRPHDPLRALPQGRARRSGSARDSAV